MVQGPSAGREADWIWFCLLRCSSSSAFLEGSCTEGTFMEQRPGLSVTLCRALGWWLRAEQEPEAAPQALSTLFRDPTDTGREHRRAEPMGVPKRERCSGLRARPRGRELVQEGRCPHLASPQGAADVWAFHTSLCFILPQLCLSGTTSSFDRCSAECVKVTQLRCGGTTCV